MGRFLGRNTKDPMAELSQDQQFFVASVEWARFVRLLRETNRFPESTDFVEKVLFACLDRNSRLSAQQDASLFRARIMPWDWNNAGPYPVSDMGAPPAHRARGGRLNPEGIPRSLVGRGPSYAEVSQSGEGVHIIFRGHVPHGVRRDNDLIVGARPCGRILPSA